MRKVLAAIAFVCLSVGLVAQVSVAVSPVAKQQFLDANNQALAGGLLYTYSAGTSSPLATYTDSTGLTQNTNPVVLDGSGFTPFGLFLSANSYKFVLQNADGVTQWTVDGISSGVLTLEGKTWESPGPIGSAVPNSGAFTTLSATTSSLGSATATSVSSCIQNGLYVVGSSCYANIAAALTAAGTTGFVSIPSSYSGSDAYVAPNKNVIDFRGNHGLGIYQFLFPSRPVTGFPLGNDLALDCDGPCDVYLINGDLGSAITTTSTSITAATPTTIAVGNSANFSITAAYARIGPGQGDTVDDACVLNSIPDTTHLNVTCVYSHSGTNDVWQKGNLVFKGFSALSLQPTQPANLSAYSFPFYIGSSFAYLMSIGVNPSDSWPHNGIAFTEDLTGMTAGSANHFPVPANRYLKNGNSSTSVGFKSSTDGVQFYCPDGSCHWVAPLTDETAGGTAAGAGAIRLRGSSTINWENNAGSGNIPLQHDTNDKLLFAGALIAGGASLTTTAATSDAVSITDVTSSSHCSLTATNATAATNIATSYISSKTTGSVTVTHTALASMTYDIVCTEQ